MTTVKYAGYPGTITSKTDRDVHFISADKLMALYRAPKRECMVISSAREYGDPRKKELTKNLIPLYPSHDGNYELKKA